MADKKKLYCAFEVDEAGMPIGVAEQGLAGSPQALKWIRDKGDCKKLYRTGCLTSTIKRPTAKMKETRGTADVPAKEKVKA